jgi:hypothetical protein
MWEKGDSERLVSSKVTQLGHDRLGPIILIFLSILFHVFHDTSLPLGKEWEVER